MPDELTRPVPDVVVVSLSFEDLYRLNYLAVLRLVVVVTGEREVLAEVVQEAFISAHRKWADVSKFDRPDLWVRRVAINRALSWRKRARLEARTLGRVTLGRERSPFSVGVDEDLWGHVRKLPRRQASILALGYIDDMTIEQAAAALGTAVPTAKTHLQRARRTLAIKLNEEADDD